MPAQQQMMASTTPGGFLPPLPPTTTSTKPQKSLTETTGSLKSVRHARQKPLTRTITTGTGNFGFRLTATQRKGMHSTESVELQNATSRKLLEDYYQQQVALAS